MKTRLSFASFASFALLSVLALAACGGSSDFTSGGSHDDSISIEKVPAEFAAAECQLFARCATVYYDILFSLEDCETLLEEQVRQGGFAELEQAVKDGRIDYDSKAAGGCIDAIGDVECPDIHARPLEACEGAFIGSVASGGECDIDEECEAGFICDTNAMCPGTCAPYRAAGLECRNNDDCASGLVCSDVTKRCVEPRAEGESCGGGVDPECDGGLMCVGDDRNQMRAGTCMPLDQIERAEANEPCDLTTGVLCGTGLSCVVVDIAGPAFACKPSPASGGSCGIGFPENCPRGEYCPVTAAELLTNTLTSNCAPLPADGEPCAMRPIDFLPNCEAYSRCEPSTGNCLGLRDLGESCTADTFCYSQHCVNGGCAIERACQ
jgi:hypothetical protein